MYGWTREPWYAEHEKRWTAMEQRGWKFSQPHWIHRRIGIRMNRQDDEITMYVSEDQAPEQIHKQLLECCEYHAMMNLEVTI